MPKGLSKSRYTAFCQCPKNLWLKVYKPEEAKEDPALQARFEQGNEVGDLAMGLIDPFRAGDYYVPAMGGSFSIKSVLPALFPNDPSLDYHKLTGGVQNGGDAMTIFPKIQHMAPVEAKAARKALKEYCKLDTWAMVKVWEKLNEKAK